MPRVQCFDCDMPVVVDPHGRCPEGHDLGPVGERIEQSLGRDEPHPDEPEPWVAQLERTEPADSEATEPRTAQPISVGPAPSDEDAGGSAEGLLQELHDLHGAGDALTPDRTESPAAARTPAPTPPATPRSDPPAAAAPAPPGSTQAPGSADHGATGSTPDAGNTPTGDPWDDWDDWDIWDDASSSDRSADDPVADGPEHDEHAASAQADPAPTDSDGVDDEPEPPPTPRRAPTLRTEESMSAIAELAALLDDDPPAKPTAGPTPPVASEDDDDRIPSGDGLATVSQLPQRTPPEPEAAAPPPPPAPPAPPADEDEDEDKTADAGSIAANGEGIDWTNFTSKGKKRRFGR